MATAVTMPPTSALSRIVHEHQVSIPTTSLVSLFVGIGLWASGAPYVKDAGVAITSVSIAFGCAYQCMQVVQEVLRTRGISLQHRSELPQV